jgi:hypothetical protein
VGGIIRNQFDIIFWQFGIIGSKKLATLFGTVDVVILPNFISDRGDNHDEVSARIASFRPHKKETKAYWKMA